MALLKRRPDISLLAPRVIVAGESFVVRAVLRCAEPVPVDAVQVELWGEGVWHTDSQYGRHRNSQGFARWVSRPVTARTELTAGEHTFPVSFQVPADVPTSYSGRLLSVEWTVRVHVDIPWWPDARATFVLFIVPSGVRAEPPPARVFATSSAGPQGQKPYVEVSLGSTALDPGGRVRGRVALSNTTHNDYRALRISLVAVESVPGLLSSTVLHHPWVRWTVPIRDPQEDVPVELALELPPSLVPGFHTRTMSLEWFLEVRIDVAWSIDAKIWIPVVVQPPRSVAGDQGDAAAPPAVGSDRLALVWAEAARQSGWNSVGGQLTREVGEFRLVIGREHRGRRGLRLRAEARFVGGHAGRASGGGLDLGLRLEGGRLRVRDPGQARMLAERTDPVAAECALASADDLSVVCTSEDAGTRVGPVAQLAERFEALVRALVDSLPELPAPADMAEMVPQFRAAARRLGGDLDLASMDVWGVRDEIPFSLQTQWDDDGTLARTVLEARPTLPVDARWHQHWAGQGPVGPMPDGLPELAAEAQGVVVDARSIQLSFPPCRDQLEPHVARLEGLLDVARRLSGQGLGYR